MADELDPVTQSFEADVTEYEAAIEDAAATAQEFADANGEVTVALDGVRDHAAEAGAALGSVRDEAAEAAAADDALRDSAAETATALGHQRDEAVEASAAMHELRDAEVETAAAGDAAAGGGISMMAAGIVALIGIIAAVAPAVVAAGAAFGAFGLFAIPTFQAIIKNIGDTQAQIEKLPVPLQNVIGGIQSIKQEWQLLSKQFAVPLENDLDKVLYAIWQVMPKLVPLAQTGAKAFGELATAISSGLQSKGFSDFLTMLNKLAGPAINALFGLAGTIGGILLNAIEQLAPYAVPMIQMLQDLLKAAGPALIGALKFIAQVIMDIGKAITPVLGPLGKFFGYLADHPVFAQIVAGIVGIVAAVKIFQGVMSAVSALSNPWVLLAVAIAIVALLIITHTHQIAEAFDLVRHTVASWGHDISSAFDTVRHTVASWGHDVASAFDTVRHTVASVGDAIAHPFEVAFNWIKSNWKLIVSWLVDPIGTAVMEIKGHTHQIAQAFDTMRHDVAAIIDGARHDISTAFDNVRHDISTFADWVPHEIAHLWDEARHYEAEALDNIRHDIASAWDNVRHETAVLVDDVLAFFAKLPGQVLSFLASLPGKMLSIGENVIKGLINGILNAAAQIPSIMAGLASDVASYFTDPLKLFSPSRLFFEHGYNIVQGAINGVKANAPNLLATMRGLGTGVGAAGTGSSLAAGAIAPATGSSSMHVTVPVTIQGSAAGAQSPQYMQGLQTAVQEAVLRYGQLNPGNGLTTAWGGTR